jgi:hypothetical protein
VFASQIFAELAAAEGVQEFVCDYLGEVKWGKDYGSFPTYRVQWKKQTAAIDPDSVWRELAGG